MVKDKGARRHIRRDRLPGGCRGIRLRLEWRGAEGLRGESERSAHTREASVRRRRSSNETKITASPLAATTAAYRVSAFESHTQEPDERGLPSAESRRRSTRASGAALRRYRLGCLLSVVLVVYVGDGVRWLVRCAQSSPIWRGLKKR